jgi:hypothetical protein
MKYESDKTFEEFKNIYKNASSITFVSFNVEDDTSKDVYEFIIKVDDEYFLVKKQIT